MVERRQGPFLVGGLFVAFAVLGVGLWIGSGALASSGATFQGQLVLRHADDFAAGKATFEHMLKLDDGTMLRLDFGADGPPKISPGSRVRVRGARDGGRIVVAPRTSQLIASAAAATTGAKKVAVILFNFSDNTSQPYTAATAAGVAFTNPNSVAAYYAENSWGKLTLSGDVYGWYTIPDTSTSCNFNTWASSANQKAAAAGVNLGAYNYVVYAFPSTGSCGWTGLAYLPGSQSWLNGAGGMSLRVMAHELGHNFNSHHASSLSCTDGGVRVSLSANSANCTASEYGDPFSVMGSASGYQHSNFSRGNFGWLQAANTLTVTTSGTYTLAPIEGYNPSAVQTLRVKRTASTYMTLEFRQPYGSYFDNFSPGDPVVNGVTVRLTPDYTTLTQSQLVDTTPGTTSFWDAPLPVGKTLVDPLTGISITDLGVSPSGATVQVSMTADASPPTQPGNLKATPLDPNRISLSWTASSDNVGVAGYRVYRGGTLLTTTTALAYTDTGLAPKTTYSYSVVAFDAAGNMSPAATATATTPAPDTSPPTAPKNLKANATKSKQVVLSWGPSGDNVKVVGYRVYRNGTLVGSTAGTSYTDSPPRTVRSATYYVVAYDAAGNVSPASNTAFVLL
jgi:chitodextrinase